jgi:hypothetical protein
VAVGVQTRYGVPPTGEVHMKYEPPAVTAVTEVCEPLIGTVTSVPNPQWSDEPEDTGH